ncbi:uncharacterized protein LOC131944544 [Physella acuta]|uniref:uncharacterized protein LOC131944544 n=1 Tax=Physella acuta TaxID=109671 RepID=UPI0027DD60C0|nr:uncharacterized protein LOC131944544 [Physella acuta]
MRCLILAASVLVFVSAQSGSGFLQGIRDWFANNNKNDFTIDFVHNYRFEEHDITGHHLIVAISDVSSDRSCHLIEVTPDWAADLTNDDKVHIISEEIYQLITTHTAQETDLSSDDLKNIYGDTDAIRECVNHKVFVLTYKPSYLTSG